MKRLIGMLVLAVACTAAAELKVATVNMVDLVKGHPNHETNRKLVKDTANDYRVKMETKQKALKEMVEEGKKLQDEWQNPMLSVSKKKELQGKLEELQQKLMAAQQEMRRDDQRYQEELNDLESRLLKIETNDIRAKITAWAEANGCDLVVDYTMCGYANPKLDVTEQILKAIGAKETAKPEKKNEGK